MRSVSEWEVADLQSLVDNKIEESLTLDYKASKALTMNDGCKKEIAKDVSALANSAGGILVYGVVEKDHLPVQVDDGVDPRIVNREWLENVITSRIQPRINGVIIRPITLASGNVCYAIEVPQATSSAPHQADHRYYKRFNFKSQPMEDYEIKDIMRRSSTPDLLAILSVEDSVVTPEGISVALDLSVTNASNQPAFYATINIWFDAELGIAEIPQYKKGDGSIEIRGKVQKMDVFKRNFGPPGHQPFYKEQVFTIAKLRLPSLKPHLQYYWGCTMTTPGMAKQIMGAIELRGADVHIEVFSKA